VKWLGTWVSYGISFTGLSLDDQDLAYGIRIDWHYPLNWTKSKLFHLLFFAPLGWRLDGL
jgi:hypothetical protein